MGSSHIASDRAYLLILCNIPLVVRYLLQAEDRFAGLIVYLRIQINTITMKSLTAFLLCLFFAVFTVLPSGAQEIQPNNRISAGAGVLTAPDLFEITSSFITIVISGGTVTSENVSSTGAAFLNYDHQLSSSVSVGMGLTYSRMTRDLMLKIADEEVKAGTGSSDYYCFMGRFNHTWLRSEWVRLYYTAAFGFTIIHDKADIDAKYKPVDNSDNSFHVAFQVTPFGIEVGKTFSVFAEGGLGYNGLIAAGLSYKF